MASQADTNRELIARARRVAVAVDAGRTIAPQLSGLAALLRDLATALETATDKEDVDERPESS